MATTYTQSLESSGLVGSSVVLVQTRIAVTELGKPGFRVINHLNYPGQLPDHGVFVVQINDPADPSRDALARVASVADFFTYPSLRAASVGVGSNYYRSSGWAEFYSDLTLALAGAANFKDRVNKLARDWMTYMYAFQAAPPGDFIELPSPDLSALQALIAAWDRAKLSKLAADAALALATQDMTAAQATLLAAQNKYNLVRDLHTVLDNLANQSVALKNFIDAVKAGAAIWGPEPSPFPVNLATGATNFWDALANLVFAIDTGGATAGISSARDTFVGVSGGVKKLEQMQEIILGVGGLQAAVAAYENRSSQVQSMVGKLDDAQNEINAADGALQASVAAKAAAARELDAANAAVQASLNAIQAMCPLFNPNNPAASYS